VISLCDRVREICPRFPGDPQTIHWSIPDAAAFERTTDELETRIRFLLHQINDPTTTQEVTRA
jgi:ArsR family transcriptional regulator, arsenate/arsenite/antimonite-responsive transcriptional repressor / arsenate reductase (thioredoxin)